jgi:RNA polymerase sigma factor (sigma-70 family)
VVNACRNEIRRRTAARRAPAERAEPAFDVHDELLELLARLSARQRAAVVLRFYEQATEREIAEALGCRPGTVKSLLHRALTHLREELQDD